MERTRPWEVSDAVWERAQALLPPHPSHLKGGRPPTDDRQMLGAILYVLRTGMQWNALPRQIGASTTVYDRFRAWERAGFFAQLWAAGLQEFDELVGIDWEGQSLDGVMTKAPFGGAATGPNPTDRGQKGVKRSTLCEGHGLGCRWRSRWRAPMSTTRSSPHPPWTRSSWSGPSRPRRNRTICAGMRALTTTCRALRRRRGATPAISVRATRSGGRPRLSARPLLLTWPSGRAGGWSNACTVGSIGRGAYWCAGRSWSRPIAPFCTWPVLSAASSSVIAYERRKSVSE
jgi:transposase